MTCLECNYPIKYFDMGKIWNGSIWLSGSFSKLQHISFFYPSSLLYAEIVKPWHLVWNLIRDASVSKMTRWKRRYMNLNMLSRFWLKSLIYKMEMYLNILKRSLQPDDTARPPNCLFFHYSKCQYSEISNLSPSNRPRSPLEHSMLYVLPQLLGCLSRTPIFKSVQKYLFFFLYLAYILR